MPAISFTAGELACPGIGADDADGLTALVNQHDSAFYASSTTASMTSAMRKFWAFLSRHRLWHLDPLGGPISVPPLLAVHLIFYVGFLIWSGLQVARQGKRQTFTSYDSLTQHCSTLRTWCRTNGRPDPGIDANTGAPDMRYVRFMRSIKRRLAGRATKRQPISLDAVRSAILGIRMRIFALGAEQQDILTAILLGFFGLLRISEYTKATQGQPFDLAIHAARGDVHFHPSIDAPERMTFFIKVSKTDQWRVGTTLITHRSGDDSFCPVMAMRRLFLRDPAADTAPLFDFTPRQSNLPARVRCPGRARHRALFNAACSAVGLNPDKAQPHSLRMGGATAMLRAGVPPIVITKLGRWASFCWTRYTWASLHTVQHAHRAIAKPNLGNAPVDLNQVRYA